ncbi:uncharacterized protein LOC125037380 isoform X1 [Penaeus chinensis]|uniref:uncharacterized protein LOC125037380 isoform X1 n=1 Tax=Penaeus chinensis TaxID=139456 RepID=UPI001FB7965A|nr:uncharacterized protein LOC125037380 isoform X1 [Penaeus chinensis]
MEVVNDVLSVMQEAMWTELERDLVLHVVASRYSHDQLLHACQLLVDWIGWRAELEDVVQTLFEGKHEGVPFHRRRTPGAAHEEDASAGSRDDGAAAGNPLARSSVNITKNEPRANARKSRIPIFKRALPTASGAEPEGRFVAATPAEAKDERGCSTAEATTAGSEIPCTKGTVCEGHELHAGREHTINSNTRIKCGCCASVVEELCQESKSARFSDSASHPTDRLSCKRESCRTVCGAESCGRLGLGDLGEESCSTCCAFEPAEMEISIKSSIPEGWVVLEGRHVAIPPVTVKLWKLITTFWDILPQFVCAQASFGASVHEKNHLQKEVKGINILLEQLSLRLSWMLPAIRKQRDLPVMYEADVSLVDESLDEDLAHMKTWVVRVYEECLVGELDIPDLAVGGSLGSRPECDSPLNGSTYSAVSQETDYFDVSDPLLAGEDKNNNVDGMNYNDPVPIVQDDLLCWLWQAVKADMDDELTVHLVASHFTLQEVHLSRNILTSWGFSLPYMKGVRGLLMEMVGAFRSVTDENNNCAVKKLPKFVCCDVTNRPSVRPMRWTCMKRDLEVLGDMAQKLTTRICWLLPEAQRYSAAMEDAKKGSLAPQLSATSSTLANLKTILDWELGASHHPTPDACARPRPSSASQFPPAVFQPVVRDCKEGRALRGDVVSLGKLQSWPVQSEGFLAEPWGGWLWGGPHVYPAMSVARESDPVPLLPSQHDATDLLHHCHLVHNFAVEPTYTPITTPQPPQRPWLPLAEPDRTKPSCIFTVMCYNVLCDKYATRQMYGYCPSWALEWEYRKKGIMDEIKHYLADIITLQEVETDQFFNFFLPELKSEGYDGIFSPKSRAKHMTESERKYVDGCAIFWRTSKFSLVKEHLIEFNQLAMANHDGSEDMLNRVMTKDNIGLAALLETKEAAWENSQLLPDKSQISQPVLVCTAHIHWDPEFCDVKLIQTIMLMSEIRQIITQIVEDSQHRSRSGHKMDPHSIQLLLCGDLNSLPDSGVVEFLTKGNVSMDHEDFKGFGYKTCLQKIAMAKTNNSLVNSNSNIYTHSFKLSAAYDFNIMAYTNYTYDFKGIIDYIFHSSETMSALGVLGPIDTDWFKDNKVLGCPHPHIPSDHFPLLVQLEMRPASASISQPNGLLHR